MFASSVDTATGGVERPGFTLGRVFRHFRACWGIAPPEELLWFAHKFDGTQFAHGAWNVDPLRADADGNFLSEPLGERHWEKLCAALMGAVRIGHWRGQPVFYTLFPQEGLPRGAVFTRSGPYSPPERLAIGMKSFAGDLMHAHAWDTDLRRVPRPTPETDAGLLVLLGLETEVPAQLADLDFSVRGAIAYHEAFGLTPVQGSVALTRAAFERDPSELTALQRVLGDHPSQLVRELCDIVEERRWPTGWLLSVSRTVRRYIGPADS